MAAESAASIDLRALSRGFGAVTAVDSLNLVIPKGELFGLVGPDGAGKTTTLRMLAGILSPSNGDAFVAGHSVRHAPEAVKGRVAYMSQRFGLYGDLTVRENLDFYADLFEIPTAERSLRIARLLSFSNLAAFQDRLADKLSGGMKQKLGLACALVHTPEIVLLDEPTNGVDPVSRRDFWRILYELLKANVTIVMTTAYLDEAERCHRVGLLHHGRLLALDTPERVKQLMPGQMIEIVVADAVRARDVLVPLPGISSVTVFGQRLHVLVGDVTSAISAATAALAAAGISAGQPRHIVPSLEDVFIAVIQGPQGTSDGRAA